MPFGDRTGPAGLGPRSGRGAGYCGWFGRPGQFSRAGGFGFFGGGRQGGGWGRRNQFYATGLTGWQRAFGGPAAMASGVPPLGGTGQDAELDVLKNQAAYFESALENIRKRIEALDRKAKAEPAPAP